MGLNLVELVMEIEDHFVVTVPDEMASNCMTVGDTHKMIVQLLVKQGRVFSPQLESEVWEELVTITCAQFGMDRAKIKSGLRWIPDLTKYG
jgi:hypothetical protein